MRVRGLTLPLEHVLLDRKFSVAETDRSLTVERPPID